MANLLHFPLLSKKQWHAVIEACTLQFFTVLLTLCGSRLMLTTVQGVWTRLNLFKQSLEHELNHDSL